MRSELESAFRRTCYRVLAPGGELLLHVDRPDAALAGLLRDSGARCAALLTAFNPEGCKQASFRNRQSQLRLRGELVRQGYSMFAARNEDPRGHWPTEPSLLVPGLPIALAREIAARYQQAAFLWSDAEGTPRLIETAARLRHRTGLSGWRPRPRRCCPIQPAA